MQSSETERDTTSQSLHQLQKQATLFKTQLREVQDQKQSALDELAAARMRQSMLEQQLGQLQEENRRWEFVSHKMREEEITRMTVLDEAISHYIKSAQFSLTPSQHPPASAAATAARTTSHQPSSATSGQVPPPSTTINLPTQQLVPAST